MIILDTPIYLSNAAAKIDATGMQITDQNIKIQYCWYDNNGNALKGGSVTISGADFVSIMQTPIPSGAVGTQFGLFLKRAILNKLKTMLNITGSIE